MSVVSLCGPSIAIQAAEHFRSLRRMGVTVRKTIDVIIATRCMADGYDLLHNNRDFDGFERHLGLKSALKSAQPSDAATKKKETQRT